MQKINGFLRKGNKIFIHGTPTENIQRIVSSEKPHLWGHFFAIDDRDRNESDKSFYEKLLSSIDVSLAYSRYNFSYKDGKFSITTSPQRVPSVVYLIGKNDKIGSISAKDCDGVHGFMGGNKTFRVEHDPMRFCDVERDKDGRIIRYVNFKGYLGYVSLCDAFAYSVTQGFKKLLENNPQFSLCVKMSAAFFWKEKVARAMIRTINKRLEELADEGVIN